MSMYVELDVDFLGVIVPKVGILITQEPSELLDDCHKTKLPGIISWNLIKTGLSGVCRKKWQRELGTFLLSNRYQSTVIFCSFVYSITRNQVESSWTV